MHLHKIPALIISLILIVLPGFGFAQQVVPGDKEIITKADKLIKKYHSDAPKAGNIIKVVYFHGKDRQPLANWNERLDRTLTAVNDFYKEEFKRFGIKTDGGNFEKEGGKYVITVISGDYDSKSYNANSGGQIQSEIFNKSGGKIDFSKDHVLILTGLTYVREDGVFVFHSPYAGSGSSENGWCFASDNEMLDPRYLSDKTTRMKFTERPGMLKDCLVAEFNSWYIGGIAHEMGHMLGLHHDFGNPAELTPSTISLMGEYGSRHFKDYLWDGSQTAHLSAAGVLQLLSNPVFTNSRKQMNTHTALTFSDIKFENTGDQMLLKANLAGDSTPYALSVLIHDTKLDEYRDESAIYPISAMGPLTIHLTKRPVGNYRASFLFMMPNGTLHAFYKAFRISAEGTELIDDPGRETFDVRRYYDRLTKMAKTADVTQKLKLLEDIIKPAVPVYPGTFTGDSLYLSDALWSVGKVGWEKPARNYFTTEQEETFFLENQGELFAKGLYAHSPSVYSFRLDKKWKRFIAIVGLRDGAHQQGSARFTVIGDGQLLYTSPALRVGDRANVNIDIQNIKVLELKTDGTEGHNYNSWSAWFGVMVGR